MSTLSFTILLAFSTLAVAADEGTNCPAAFRAYSADTPLLDLLINSATREIVNRDLPGFLDKMPKVLVGDTPPTLADVLTIRIMAGEFGAIPKEAIDKLDKDLAAVPQTHESAVARCARYDETPPTLPDKIDHPAILVFSKSNGFRDNPSVDGASAALKAMAERRHWNLVFEDNAAVFNAKDLKHFDAVIWNNVSGDMLTIPQRKDFKAYVENGGGFAAFHGSGGDPYVDWDWYADTLIGARFLSHPMSPQFQEAKVHVDDAQNPIVKDLQPEWSMTDEWYSFKSNPRKKGAHILLTLDEKTYSPMSRGMDLHMGDHPIAWTQCVGKGRSFYSAIGHKPEGYSEPNTNKLMEQGIVWTLESKGHACR
jgi:type 1 glutamine amidotransferase